MRIFCFTWKLFEMRSYWGKEWKDISKKISKILMCLKYDVRQRIDLNVRIS